MNRNGFTQKRHNSNNQIITKSQPHQNGHKKYYPNDDSCAMARNTNQQNHRQVVDYVVAENIKKMIPFQQKQSNSCGIKEITKNHNTESQNNSTENEDDVPVVVEKVFLGQPISLESENIEIDDLPKMSVDKQFQTGQSVRVFISLIHSPYKFWFQVYDSADMIDSLMEHLEYDQFSIKIYAWHYNNIIFNHISSRTMNNFIIDKNPLKNVSILSLLVSSIIVKTMMWPRFQFRTMFIKLVCCVRQFMNHNGIEPESLIYLTCQ